MAESSRLEDEFDSLERDQRPNAVRVLAVASGKGGVGKSNLSVNLSCVLAQRKKSVLLLDADLGLANADVILGVHPQYDLHDVIRGERSLEDIVVHSPLGVGLIPASSGVKAMAELSSAEHAGLIRAFSELSMDVDYLIIDTAAGISDSVISFCQGAQEVLVVVCDEPASITDAYALIKVLNRDAGLTRVQIVANMVKSPVQGQDLFHKLDEVAAQYLNISLGYLGHIPFDEAVRVALRRRSPVVNEFPTCKASQAVKRLADNLEDLPLPKSGNGHIEFFVERMV